MISNEIIPRIWSIIIFTTSQVYLFSINLNNNNLIDIQRYNFNLKRKSFDREKGKHVQRSTLLCLNASYCDV